MNELSREQIRNQLLKELRLDAKNLLQHKELLNYIDELLLKSESKEYKNLLDESVAFEHADMQIPLSQARFLESLIKMINAKKVLEVGTFHGFSTVFLARSLAKGGKVITIDHDSRRYEIAQKLWKSVGLIESIELIKEDAKEYLKRMISDKSSKGTFDLVFIDADKANYELYLEYSMHLVRQNGVILIDNILWAGLVAYDEPGDNVGRNLKKFNELLFEKYGQEASIVPAWDGLIFIVKK